jgi:hypothetical protein
MAMVEAARHRLGNDLADGLLSVTTVPASRIATAADVETASAGLRCAQRTSRVLFATGVGTAVSIASCCRGSFVPRPSPSAGG